MDLGYDALSFPSRNLSTLTQRKCSQISYILLILFLIGVLVSATEGFRFYNP